MWVHLFLSGRQVYWKTCQQFLLWCCVRILCFWIKARNLDQSRHDLQNASQVFFTCISSNNNSFFCNVDNSSHLYVSESLIAAHHGAPICFHYRLQSGWQQMNFFHKDCFPLSRSRASPIPPSLLTASSSSKALGSNWWNSFWPFPAHLATSSPLTGARRGQVRAQHFILRHNLQNLIWKPEILIIRHIGKERTGEYTFANNCLQFL